MYLKIRIEKLCRFRYAEKKRLVCSCPQMKESGTSRLQMHDGLAYTLAICIPGLHRKGLLFYLLCTPLFPLQKCLHFEIMFWTSEWWIGYVYISCAVSMEQSRLELVRPSCQSCSDVQFNIYIQNFSLVTELRPCSFLLFWFFLCDETTLIILNDVQIKVLYMRHGRA